MRLLKGLVVVEYGEERLDFPYSGQNLVLAAALRQVFGSLIFFDFARDPLVPTREYYQRGATFGSEVEAYMQSRGDKEPISIGEYLMIPVEERDGWSGRVVYMPGLETMLTGFTLNEGGEIRYLEKVDHFDRLVALFSKVKLRLDSSTLEALVAGMGEETGCVVAGDLSPEPVEGVSPEAVDLLTKYLNEVPESAGERMIAQWGAGTNCQDIGLCKEMATPVTRNQSNTALLAALRKRAGESILPVEAIALILPVVRQLKAEIDKAAGPYGPRKLDCVAAGWLASKKGIFGWQSGKIVVRHQ